MIVLMNSVWDILMNVKSKKKKDLFPEETQIKNMLQNEQNAFDTKFLFRLLYPNLGKYQKNKTLL